MPEELDPNLADQETPQHVSNAGVGDMPEDAQPEVDQTDIDDSDEPQSQRRWVRMASGCASVALFLGALGALWVSQQPLEAHAVMTQGVNPKVSFAWPPLRAENGNGPAPAGTWVNQTMQEQLQTLVLEKLSRDPFDVGSLTSARGALLETGWFRDDLRLVRDSDGTVNVQGTWRVPASAVRTNGSDILITQQGERLPLEYRPDASGYKVIIGVRHEAPKAGEAWLGGDVQAGLKLMELLAQMPIYDQVAAVDISDFDSKNTLHIVTDLGNKVIWGGPIDQFNPGQAMPSVKLARLIKLRREHGRIDASRPLVDIRLQDGIYIVDTAGVLSHKDELTEKSTKGKTGNKPAPKPAVKPKGSSRT